MRSLISKFYILGIIIATIIALGLFFQFRIFNTIISDEVKALTNKSCDLTASEIKSKLANQAHAIEDTAAFISMDNWTEDQLLSYFKKMMKKDSIFYSIYFGSKDNHMVNGSGWIPPKEFDLRTRPWYIKAVKEKKLILTEAFVNASKDKLVITVAMPVYDNENKLLGVVAGDASVKDILAAIQQYKIGENGYSFIIDGKGNILAHPDYPYEQSSKLVNINEESNGLKELMSQSNSGDAKVTMDGVAGYLVYQGIEHTDWLIGSFIPMSEINKENIQFMIIFVMILIFSLTIFLFLLWLQRKYIIQPISSLDQDVKKINVEQNRSYRVPFVEKDPFFVLRESVNTILTKAEQFFTQLDEETSKLAESLDRNTAIINAIPDLLFINDQNGNYIDAKVGNEQLLLMPREHFIGKTIWEVLPKELCDQTWKCIQAVLQDGTQQSFEYYLDLPVGRKCFEVRMTKSRENEVITLSRDITESKSMAQEIFSISERLAMATEAANIGIWEYDIVNSTLVWDDAMYRLYGITKESFSGAYEAWEQGLHPEDLERCRQHLYDAILGIRAFNPEFRVVWPDGSVHHIKANAMVIKDENGKALKMIGTNWDISERIHYETELLKAKELAEAANIAKSQFLANMSHEIRTPMNGIFGYLELLNMSSLSMEQKDYVKEAKIASEGLLNLINDILDFSKIEAGKLQMENINFSVRNAVGASISLFAPIAAEKKLKLYYSVDPTMPEQVIGDPTRLKQILNNLISNAVKFTDQGEVFVGAHWQQEENDIALLGFEVRDTGIGIREEDLERLFQSFNQIDASTTRKYGGTGLGLAISKELINLMHGKISIASEYGKGTVFTFEVRVKLTEAFGESKQRIDTLGNKIGIEDGNESMVQVQSDAASKPAILLVEDNEMNRKIVSKILKIHGFACDMAFDGLQALDAVKEKDYDLIFMDCQLPMMDGYQSTMQIRELEGNKRHTPIIAMTANAMQGDREKCIAAGMDDYISKPIEFQSMLDKIETYTKK